MNYLRHHVVMLFTQGASENFMSWRELSSAPRLSNMLAKKANEDKILIEAFVVRESS
jgi:hypothetical protein